jgi:hypothetical protein
MTVVTPAAVTARPSVTGSQDPFGVGDRCRQGLVNQHRQPAGQEGRGGSAMQGPVSLDDDGWVHLCRHLVLGRGDISDLSQPGDLCDLPAIRTENRDDSHVRPEPTLEVGETGEPE